MKRYFFDVVARTSVLYDYRGRDFARLEQVRELAELIALDIHCTEGEDSDLVEIQVRNVGGQKMMSVPVGELMAA